MRLGKKDVWKVKKGKREGLKGVYMRVKRMSLSSLER